MFPVTVKEYHYGVNVECSFKVIIDLIKQVHNKDVSVNELKKELINVYNENVVKYGLSNMMNIFKNEGKVLFASEVLKNRILIEDLIASDEYYLSNLDFVFLSYKYDIPLITITSNARGLALLMGRDENKMWINNIDIEQPFYVFVREYRNERERTVRYAILMNEGNAKFNYSEIKQNMKNVMKKYTKRPDLSEILGGKTKENEKLFVDNNEIDEVIDFNKPVLIKVPKNRNKTEKKKSPIINKTRKDNSPVIRSPKTSTVFIFNQNNPKRQGTNTYIRYEKYKKAKNVKQARELGATSVDLNDAIKKPETHLQPNVNLDDFKKDIKETGRKTKKKDVKGKNIKRKTRKLNKKSK